MARTREREKRVGKRQSRIDPGIFLQQPRQAESELSDLGTLMTLLGLGPKAEQERTESERLARAQEAQQAYYEGLIGAGKASSERERESSEREKEKLAITKKETEEAARLRGLQEEDIIDRRRREIEAQQEVIKLRALEGILAQPDTLISPEEKRQAVIEANLGKSGEVLTKAEEAKQRTRTKKFKTGLEEAYKKSPAAVETFVKSQQEIPGIEEIMRDPTINWQALNVGLKPEVGFVDRLMSAIRGGGEAPAGVPTETPVPTETTPRPMAFTGYEQPFPVPSERRGYGAVPGGPAGRSIVDMLSDVLAGRETPRAEMRGPLMTARIPAVPSGPASTNDLLSLIAPPVSAAQEGGYAPSAEFPRQMQPLPFEYGEGYPSAMPGTVTQEESARLPWLYGGRRWQMPVGGGALPTMHDEAARAYLRSLE